jgi:hypothetical protein
LNKSKKIIGAILLTFLFLISGIISSSAYSINKEYVTCESPEEIDSFSRTITIFKYGINGDITPVDIKIDFNNLEEINEAISDKCEELLMNDNEFKSFNSSISLGIFTFVKSHGRGIHLKPFSKSKILYCRYPRDTRAYTSLTSILGGPTKTVSGPHSVVSFGFIGFKWWFGRISILGLFLRTGYVGYSSITTIRRL